MNRWKRIRVVTSFCVVLLVNAAAALASSPQEIKRAPSGADSDARRVIAFEWDALEDYTGNASGNYLAAGLSVSEQLRMALASVDDPSGNAVRSVALDYGYTLSFGCRRGSCDDKAAVISDQEGRVVRAALISDRCGDLACEQTPMLKLFMRSDRLDDEQDVLLIALMAWANARVPDIWMQVVEILPEPLSDEG